MATKHRVVVLEQVHYQADGENPVSHESKFSRFCNTDDVPLSRTVTVRAGNEPMAVDFGWMEEPSQLLVNNKGAGLYDRIPTPDQKQHDQARHVQVLLDNNQPFCTLPPGESCRLRPVKGVRYFLKATGDDARVVITLLPS